MEPAELMFGESADPGQVFATLATRYGVHAEPSSAGRWTCVDTADWRLHRNGMTLRDARRGRSAQLVLSTADHTSLTAPAPPKHWPRRIETLPASPVRERIEPAVGVRALLPLAEVDVRSVVLRLLDDERKTRVRVRVDQQRLSGSGRAPLPLRVVVAPVRGYERDADRCSELLAESMKPLPAELTAASVAMTAAGHKPGAPVVPTVALDGASPAHTALVQILRRWMDVIDAVRPGVLADVDIEYLHDMRTAVRATRSMLTLAGDLLPNAHAERFADEFAWLGRLTAPVRDLDVALLEVAGRGDTDLSGIDGLEPLARHIESRRRGALRSLRTGLQSNRAVALGSDWRRALDGVANPDLPAPTTAEHAAGQARKAYKRIVEAAAPVHNDTPPDELHRLRKRCKRMRYLLESYGPVFAPAARKDVLRALKSLQDCLGDIQDVDVQRDQLSQTAATLARRGASTDTVLAVGAFRDRTLRRDAAAREVLARRLERFCSPLMQAQVRALGSQA